MTDNTTLHITEADLDADGFYIGATDVSQEFDGSIQIAADLGLVRFKFSLRAKYSIRSLAGSSISAGGSIEAGESIEAGWSISAGWFIKAGDSIEAGWSISAGWFINAGGSIEAGESIEAGRFISAGWISTPLRIFAGLCSWRMPTPAEMEIRAELRSGTIAFGTHVAPAVRDKP